MISFTNEIKKNEEVGNKAYNLFLLKEKSISVPSFVCLTKSYFNFHLKPIKKQIDYELSTLLYSFPSTEKVSVISKRIKQLILNLNLNLKNEIESDRFRLNGLSFAVRSSCIEEDGRFFSFAGQLSSYLYVPKNQLIKKIKECWASSYNENVLHYLIIQKKRSNKKLLDLNEFPLNTSIIVQEMVDGERSGVMFTSDPRKKFDYTKKKSEKEKSIIITAGYGLGEGIVSDLVETDTYTVSNNRTKVESQKKLISLKKSKGELGGLTKKLVPLDLQNKNVLDEKSIKDLKKIGEKIEKIMGSPQDIEWVIDKKGKVYITQTRPITNLEKKRKNKSLNLQFFDNSNIVESFPGINTPLTISVVKIVYSTVFYNAIKRMGFSKKVLSSEKKTFSSLLGFYKGRAYYNLTQWYKMMRLVPFMERYIDAWEESLGVEKSDFTKQKNYKNQRTIIIKILLAIKIFSKMGFYFIFLNTSLKKLNKELQSTFFNFWKLYNENRYDSKLCLKNIEILKKEIFKKWEITLFNDIFAFIFSSLSKKLLLKWKVDSQENCEKIFNDLLCGQGEMESVAPIKSILELSDIVKKNKVLESELKSSLVENKKIEFSDNFFQNKFDYHIDLFGDRGVEELKLETISFREDPKSLIKLILDYIKTDISLSKINIKNIKSQKRSLITLEKNLKKNPLKRLVFKLIFSFAKRSIIQRENFRLHRSRAYGILRRLFNRIGEEYLTNGIIENRRDIFYLSLEEISNFQCGNLFSYNLKDLISIRKKAYSSYFSDEVEEKYTFDGFKFTPKESLRTEISKNYKILEGKPCSSGSIKGEVLVIRNLDDIKMRSDLVKGKILVAPMTDPGWVYWMNLSSGLIVEKGSILSHTAIIGRELGIPTIVMVEKATQILRTGDFIQMDGKTGSILILNKKEQSFNQISR